MRRSSKTWAGALCGDDAAGCKPLLHVADIAHTNTAAVEAALHALEQRLAHLRENLRTPELADEFDQANRFRRE